MERENRGGIRLQQKTSRLPATQNLHIGIALIAAGALVEAGFCVGVPVVARLAGNTVDAILVEPKKPE